MICSECNESIPSLKPNQIEYCPGCRRRIDIQEKAILGSERAESILEDSQNISEGLNRIEKSGISHVMTSSGFVEVDQLTDALSIIEDEDSQVLMDRAYMMISGEKFGEMEIDLRNLVKEMKN